MTDPRKHFPSPEWNSENSVTVLTVDEIVFRAWDKVPLDKPWPLAVLLPKAEILVSGFEEEGGDPRVVDAIRQLVAHIDRLEGVRKYFEDLLLAEGDETQKPRSEG